MGQVVVIAAVAAAYALLILYAARRVRSGSARWLWVAYSFRIVPGLFLVGAAVVDFKATPAIALVTGLVGLVWAAIGMVFVLRAFRAVELAATPEQRADALVSPSADYMLAMVAVGLLGGLAMLLGLLYLALAGQL